MKRLLLPFLLLACGGPIDPLTDDSAELWSGDAPYIDYDRCNSQQEATIGASLLSLRANIHPRFGGPRYLECLKDAVYSEVWGKGATPEDIYRTSNAPGELEISCVDLDDGVWGLASLCDGTQQIEVDSGVVDDVGRGRLQSSDLGAVILHELLHVRDGGCFSHPDMTGTIDYELSVNRQAQRCASPTTPLVPRKSLSGKVPLAWIGWSAPAALSSSFRRVSLACPDDQVVVGVEAGTGSAGLRRLGLRCARPGATTWDRATLGSAGAVGPTVPSLVQECPADRALVGLSARYDRDGSGTRMGALSASCWPIGHLRSGTGFAAISTLSFGSGGSTEAARTCPEGRALVGLTGIERGTARTLEALQPICRPIREIGRRDLTTYSTGTAVGGTGGSPASLRCLGNGVATGLTGGSGARIDRLALVCTETDLGGGVLGGTLSVSPAVGGTGGGSFSSRCGPGQALVGLSGRAGALIDRLAPVCADFASWRAGSTSTTVGTANGGGGGSEFRRLCGAGRFVVGLRTRSGTEVDSVQLVCSDGLRPTI